MATYHFCAQSVPDSARLLGISPVFKHNSIFVLKSIGSKEDQMGAVSLSFQLLFHCRELRR